MKLEKLNLQNQRHLDEVFKKLDSCTFDHTEYGKKDGRLILGKTAYVFSLEAEEYWNCFLLKILTLKGLNNFVSLKTIEKEIRPIYEDFLITKTPVNVDDFNSILVKLEKLKVRNTTYYFKVYGLHVHNKVKVDNICISQFNNYFKEKIENHLFKITEQIKIQENGLNENRSYYLDKITDKIKEYNNFSVIEVSNLGDDDLSYAQSIQDAQNFLNEIIFAISISSNLNHKIGFEKTNQDEIQIRVNYTEDSIGLTSQKLLHGASFSLENNEFSNVDKIYKNYSFPLYSKKYHFDLINNLQNAINWFADAANSKENRKSFLFYAIGLEALFTLDHRENITKNLAESCAFLLSTNLQSRKNIFKNITYLYQQRSGIAHGGNKNIETADLRMIKKYLAYSILSIITLIQEGKLYSIQDFKDFLLNEKFK
ncbi:hypothetical protein I6L25_00710 [Acinetobacter nosocomialis]|uniref:HEPN domain-containing protein n=1 Tax=Acinetobacter nosocomialis TaxID=106654 RepID=UPI0003AAE4FC|nr:HEPN domain-containing protein [Acinetobacter nosocomialis]QXC12430.1 hypothetical protein I6L25_00710 [Acinetobacter nosocomialis]